MRILNIFDDYGEPGRVALPGNGSVSEVVYHIAKYAAQKHEVTILERDHGYLPEKENIDSIDFVRIRSRKLPAPPYRLIRTPAGLFRLLSDGFSVARKLKKFVTEDDFDVIHVHFPFAVNILLNFDRKVGEKMVYTAHIGEEKKRFNLDSGSPLALKLFSPDLYLMRRVKKSVVLNEPLRFKLISKGIEEESLEVIPNGVEVEEYGRFSEEEIERVKEKYGMTGKTTVMFAGTITPRKGVETLIRAAYIIVNNLKRRDALFLFVGNLSIDKEFADKVKEYVSNRNLESNVKFTGFVSHKDLRVLYTACDIFVLPSFEEGFGMVLTEAMASGKPLIGTNVGGIPMQIVDDWNGFLIQPGNEKQLAEKTKYMMDNPADREKMGRNGRKLAEKKFDWSKIAENYLKVYDEICEEYNL